MGNDKFNDFINEHPRECLRILVIVLCFSWQSIAALIGIVAYVLLSLVAKIRWPVILSAGIVIALLAVFFSTISFYDLIPQGFTQNLIFWKVLFSGGIGSAILTLECSYIIGLPLLMSGVLCLIDLKPIIPHENEMIALQSAQHDSVTEASEKVIELALRNLHDEDHDGTALGVSKYTGQYCVIPDRYINQVALVLGTTGSGKTITLRRFYKRAIMKGYPLIIVDGKPDDENIAWLMRLSEQCGRNFYGFNCGNKLPYDPLANGGYTELKDKIISLKDEWSSDHYRSIAEDYLQATFEVLLRSGLDFDLKRVVECLNYDELVLLVREIDDPKLMKRVASLERYDRKDITGLQAHLNILIYSELGAFFEKNIDTFTLPHVIQGCGVAYFALPALRFPSFSKVLGKLVINDLKAVIDRNDNNGKKIFTVFDEFSVFAGEQVLNLVNMGRGKGVHAIFGTQGLADLDRIDSMFKNQVMNCVNTLVCHRLNDQESAESVASWVGTRDVFTVTAQVNIRVLSKPQLANS